MVGGGTFFFFLETGSLSRARTHCVDPIDLDLIGICLPLPSTSLLGLEMWATMPG